MAETKYNIGDIRLPRHSLNGIYRGVVEDNKDVLKAGRCKIRVFGIHTDVLTDGQLEGISTANLIWAEPATPIYGGISKVGIFGVPKQGAHVFLFFENGNIMQPRYFATAPGIPKEPANTKYGFYDPDGVYPLKEHLWTPDWNEGIGNEEAEYPNSFVIADEAGNKIEFDSTPGKEKIIIEHGKTHARILFTAQGGITHDSGSQSEKTFSGSRKNVIDGDSSLIITGKHDITASDMDENILGTKRTIISEKSEEVAQGEISKKSGGLSWDVEGTTKVITSGEASFVAGEDCNIKSNDQNVKIEALKRNIEMLAQLGEISGRSVTYNMLATMTATLKGNITTTVGGGTITDVKGTITTVDGSALTKITGGVILIG